MTIELEKKAIQQADILADAVMGNQLAKELKTKWFQEGVRAATAKQPPSVLWNDVQRTGYKTQLCVMAAAKGRL